MKTIFLILFSVFAMAQQNGWQDLPAYGNVAWKKPVANFAALPANGNKLGDARVTQSTNQIYIWNGAAWVTTSGTVTSVGLSLPSIFNVSGSPVTTSGTLTATLANESANTVFAGPSSGGAAPPTFRALVNADIPYVFSAPLINTAGTISITQSGAASNGYLSSVDWNTFNGKQAAGNYITALTGDGTASGPGSAALTFATVNGNVGSFGTASNVGSFTVNGKGLITAASNIPILITEAQVTNLVSDLAGKQPTGNYITALIGDVTAAGPGSSAASLVATSNSTLTTLSALLLPTSQLSGTINLASQVSGVLPIANGGTNNGSLAITAGGTLYTDGTKLVNVGAGTSGQFLKSNGASAPTWATPSAGSGGILCDLSVGPAQTYTTIGAALAAASSGQSICIQTGTYVENPIISIPLSIYGSGRGVIISGSLEFAAGSDFSLAQQLKVTGGITIDAAVNGVQLLTFWNANGQTVTDNGTGSFVQGMQE